MHIVTSNLPPTFVAPVASAVLAPDDRLPESIFGKLPTGFTLERQHITMLDFWHHKACEAIKALPEDASDDECNAIHSVRQRLFAAIKTYKPTRGFEVARQLEAICDALDTDGNLDLDEVMTADDFRAISAHLSDVTGPQEPKKYPGSQWRGNKLTRTGLLIRYASLLMTELATISHSLYGDPDYLKQFNFKQAAIRIGVDCAAGVRRRKFSPFNDESRLTLRARLVLKSLKIDVEYRDESGPRRRRKGKR